MASKDIGTLRTRLSWEDEGSTKSLEGFKRDLKGLRSEMNLAKSGGREYTNSLKGMREQSDILSRRFKTQEERVKELKKRYDESVKVKGEDAVATKDLQAQLNNATAEMNRTEGQLQRLNEEIRRLESPWTKLGERMTDAGEKFQTVGRHMTDFGKDYSMKVTAPIVAGGTALFKASMDYETAFAGVRKTVDATEEQFAELSTGIKAMAKEIPAAATEIANVAEVAGQLGIKREDILKFTRVMVDLGVATTMSSEEAATSLARLANITQMPMDQIDRLGSTIVDLGNNLATTEGEIVDMALRLAGAGSQIGLTESQILAFAGALSSVGIQAEMGGSAFSRVMIEIANASANGEAAVKGFSDVAGMSAKDFRKAFEDDAALAVIAFIEGLDKMSKSGENVFGVLEDLGLAEIRVRDTLLRASGAGDLFRESLELGSKAWEENIALTEEAEERYKTSESQLKIMWNRVKDVAITLGDALVPAVMSALDAAGPLIEKIESGAQAFADMDEGQQRTIIKLIALTAAVGPAAIGLGQLSLGIGGILKVGGSLATTLGRAGGTGLVGRIGLLGLGTNPVGLAVAGVGALTLGIYAATKASEESTEEILKSIEKRKEEIESVDDLIASFEELQVKNKLSTDEVLRYMDIMNELKDAESEEAIKALTEEQEKLLEKSGLTNEEMEEFLSLNDQVIEKSPETAKAISEQGNAYAETLDELKKLNDAERKRLTDDTYMAITNEIHKQRDNLEKQTKLQEEIGGLESERKKTLNSILGEGEKIRDVDLEIARLMKEIDKATGDEQLKLMEKVSLLEDEKYYADLSKTTLEGRLKDLDKEIKKKSDSLGKTEEELKAFDKLTDEYAQMVLYQEGIVSEKGKAVEAVQKEQKEIDKARQELEKMKKSGKDVGGEYDEQNRKLNEQQGKLDSAKRKLEEMNVVAGKKIYKDIDISTNPTISGLNKLLGQTISKKVNVNIAGATAGAGVKYSYATGTDYHPGGRALTGEEGQELARFGNRWSMLGFGVHDLPRGTQVFTHDETKNIISALNRMPAYASGVSPQGEANRVVSQLNNQQQVQTAQPIVLEVHVTSEIDGRVAGHAVERYITEIQDRKTNRRRKLPRA